MDKLGVDELRAFLAGDDTHLASGELIWGYFDGKWLGNPSRRQNRSEIVDGKLVVESPRSGRLAEFPLADLSCVAYLSVRRMLQEHPSVYTWAVEKGGTPLAEVPWGADVQRQADDVGLRLRQTMGLVDKKAFKAVRPELRLH